MARLLIIAKATGMKHCIIILLLELCSIALFSQSALREFVVEKDDNPQVFYKAKGCTPDDGVLVFYSFIPDLKFSMPDTPSRLKNLSAFDTEHNCYVLCVQPTDTGIGGISQYSISITGKDFKPMPAFMVSGINAGIVQYFNIILKEDWKDAYERLKKELAEMKGENNVATGTLEQQHITEMESNKSPAHSDISWFQEGMKNSKEGNYSEAIRCYSNALEINPNMSEAWYNLGIACGREKKMSEALKYYQKAAQLGNKDAQRLLILMGRRW